MTQYDIYAKFYDLVEAKPEAVLHFLRTNIEKYHPSAKTLLELACGTGNIIADLAQDFEVSGVDLSEPMLEKARAKLPATQLVQGDMSNFTLSQKFDVIICMYDSINHLIEYDQWAGMFASTAAHLNPGGLLIFDMNTIGRLKQFAEPGILNSFKIELENFVMLLSGQAHDDLTQFHLQFFEKDEADGKYTYSEEKIYERSFSLNDIRVELLKHFEVLQVSDRHGAELVEDNGRAYIICRKPL